jgi:hypothetical protein
MRACSVHLTFPKMAKGIPSLAQLPMYMRSIKRGEARLWIHPILTPLADALGAILIAALLPMACKQVKPMKNLPWMRRVGLALLSRSPRPTER